MSTLNDIKVGEHSIKFIWSACELCGKERWVKLQNGKPRSSKCKPCAQRNRFLGIKYSHGYRYVKRGIPDFFAVMICTNGYVAEHRLVMAKSLGR